MLPNELLSKPLLLLLSGGMFKNRLGWLNGVPVGLSVSKGFTRFSFCLRLQNHTLTTSRSIQSFSDRAAISSLVGLLFIMNAFSRAPRTVVSIDVRFFLLLPICSGLVRGLVSMLILKILEKRRRKWCYLMVCNSCNLISGSKDQTFLKNQLKVVQLPSILKI